NRKTGDLERANCVSPTPQRGTWLASIFPSDGASRFVVVLPERGGNLPWRLDIEQRKLEKLSHEVTKNLQEQDLAEEAAPDLDAREPRGGPVTASCHEADEHGPIGDDQPRISAHQVKLGIEVLDSAEQEQRPDRRHDADSKDKQSRTHPLARWDPRFVVVEVIRSHRLVGSILLVAFGIG